MGDGEDCYLTVLLAAQRDANPNAPNEQVTEKLGQQMMLKEAELWWGGG